MRTMRENAQGARHWTCFRGRRSRVPCLNRRGDRERPLQDIALSFVEGARAFQRPSHKSLSNGDSPLSSQLSNKCAELA